MINPVYSDNIKTLKGMEEVNSTSSSLFNILEFLKGKNIQEVRYSIIFNLADIFTSTNLIDKHKRFSNIIGKDLGWNNNLNSLYLFKTLENALAHVEAISASSSKLFSDSEKDSMEVIDSYLRVLMTNRLTPKNSELNKGFPVSAIGLIKNKNLLEGTYLSNIKKQRNLSMVVNHFREELPENLESYSSLTFIADSRLVEYCFETLLNSDDLIINVLESLKYKKLRTDILDGIESLYSQERRYLSLLLLELFSGRSIQGYGANTALITQVELNNSKKLDFKLPFKTFRLSSHTALYNETQEYFKELGYDLPDKVIRFILTEYALATQNMNVFPVLNDELHLKDTRAVLRVLEKCWDNVFSDYEREGLKDLQYVPIIYLEYMRVSNILVQHPEVVVDDEYMSILSSIGEYIYDSDSSNFPMPDYYFEGNSENAFKDVIIDFYKHLSTKENATRMIVSSLTEKSIKSQKIFGNDDVEDVSGLISILNHYNLLR